MEEVIAPITPEASDLNRQQRRRFILTTHRALPAERCQAGQANWLTTPERRLDHPHEWERMSKVVVVEFDHVSVRVKRFHQLRIRLRSGWCNREIPAPFASGSVEQTHRTDSTGSLNSGMSLIKRVDGD